jgi:5-methylcytosine-specific restriction enzyme A
MPGHMARVCTHPGCTRLSLDGSGRCPNHPRPKFDKRPRQDGAKRMAGRKLQTERSRMVYENPLCAECERNGLVRLGTQRDHIIPWSQGGADTPDNTQLLCDECHTLKTQAEIRAARGMGSGG